MKKGPISKEKAIFKLNKVCGIIETEQLPEGFYIFISGRIFWTLKFRRRSRLNSLVPIL